MRCPHRFRKSPRLVEVFTRKTREQGQYVKFCVKARSLVAHAMREAS